MTGFTVDDVDVTGGSKGTFTAVSGTVYTLSDGITNDATISITGLEKNASWQYSTDDGSTWETGTGTSFELAEGEYAVGDIEVRQTDTAGNTSEATQNDSAITVDTTVSAPSFALASDTGSGTSDAITNDATINVTLASDVAS